MTADQGSSLVYHSAESTDPRVDRTELHDLLDIVAIAICAVVAGAGSWGDIEDFGEAKRDRLKTFLALPNGIPSHGTFRRVLERLDPDEFQRCFLGRIGALHEATDRQVIALDGKTLRRSFDRAEGRSPLHLVHAWATANHLPLGQVAVGEKSNEITAIPELLRRLELSGAIVTTDAVGRQKEIARTIRDRGPTTCWPRRPTTSACSSRSRRPGSARAPAGGGGTASATIGGGMRDTAGPRPGGAGRPRTSPGWRAGRSGRACGASCSSRASGSSATR